MKHDTHLSDNKDQIKIKKGKEVTRASLTPSRKKELLAFCKLVNIRFCNLKLLNQAFNHRSITNEIKDAHNNERLEFLGDSVLGMATASYLYNTLENPEGDLAKIKSYVVSEKALAPIAARFGLNKLLVLGHGEEMSGGREKPAILADCMEAVIGAYYLDSGFKAAEKYVLSFIVPEIEKVCKYGMKDYKTRLQEKYQKAMKELPRYKVLDRKGPDHEQTFSVVVQLGDKVYGPAFAKTKKDAEQKAAQIALEQHDFGD